MDAARIGVGDEPEHTTGQHRNWKALALQGVIAALVISALVGVYAFAFGQWGQTEMKVLLTTLSFSLFGTISLVCGAAWEKRQVPALAVPGFFLGLAGLVIFVLGIWAEFARTEAFAKLMVVSGVFAFSFAHASALSFAVPPRRLWWVYAGTLAASFAVAGLVSAWVVYELRDEVMFRITGTLGILDGCGTIALPILGRLQREKEAKTAKTTYEIELLCPRCRECLAAPAGTIRCRRCGLTLQLTIES
jgi:hypothetical protein